MAYATEEILLVLVLAGTVALWASVPIGLGIAVLVAIVISSYRQTILAYPGGGGAYIVTRENLGRYPSLVAGAALLIDYVLTVAVSIAAGIAAITSAFPALYPYRVWLCVVGRGADHARQPAGRSGNRASSSPRRPTCSSAPTCS